jgi:hypothetical protein
MGRNRLSRNQVEPLMYNRIINSEFSIYPHRVIGASRSWDWIMEDDLHYERLQWDAQALRTNRLRAQRLAFNKRKKQARARTGRRT